MRFEECFWGSDFNSTAGFDTLCKRMKDGKQMRQDFEEFIKQRADCEEKYGKSLMKLAGTDSVEIGSLRDSWDILRQETENIGKAHVEYGQQLLENIERATREFREEQRSRRKPVEENIKRAQRNKKTCFDTHVKAKKLYEQRCRENDTCLEMLRKSASSQSRDEEKLRLRFSKAKTTVENTDANYQTHVKELEDSRKEWEREMAVCCNIFQELEKERIHFLRNCMWTYANLGSSNSVKIDEHYEAMRKSLEHCDIEADINFFISKKQTGSERPAPILYENFYTAQNNQKAGLPAQGRAAPAQRPSLPSLPSTPVTQQNNVKPFEEDIDNDPTYASVHEVRQRSKPVVTQRTVVAEFDYTAQGSEELSFRAGDVIKFIREEDSTWWFGEFNGKRGMFPRQFVNVVK